jgi:hypothetical protein
MNQFVIFISPGQLKCVDPLVLFFYLHTPLLLSSVITRYKKKEILNNIIYIREKVKSRFATRKKYGNYVKNLAFLPGFF